MKGQNTNRILPIKSLLENLKQQTKRQYLQLDTKHPPSSSKNTAHFQPQNNVASRIPSTNSVAMTHRPHFHNELNITQPARQLQKGISLNKTSEKNNSHQHARQLMHAVQFPHPSFYTPKKDKNSSDNHHLSIITQDTFKMDAQLEHQYHSKNNRSEQYFHQTYKQVLKNPEHKTAEDGEKEALNLTEKFNSKFEEETRYVSKFQKIDSLPIFKDEVTKIKTELYQKEATLFEKTQELEEKERIIASLQDKLSRGKNSDHSAKQREKELKETIEALNKRIQEQQEEINTQRSSLSELEQKFEAQTIVIDQLRNQLQETSEQLCRYEEDNATNYALINLKIRQYEVQEKQRSHQITEIKEKERRTFEHQERIIKNLSESLREKEEIISDLKSKIATKQEVIKKQQQIVEEKGAFYAKELENKEYLIRELLAEEGDLKNSLKNMEFRIREMIEQEEQLKKMVEEKKHDNEKLMASFNIVKNEFELANSQIASLERQKANQIQRLQAEIQQLKIRLSQASESKKSLEELHQTTIKDLQLRLTSASESFSQRQLSFIQRTKQLEDTLKQLSAANRSISSKTSTSKLIKDNERLSLIIKDIDGRLYQSLKLNHVLNEQIAKRELQALNDRFSRFSDDFE